MLRPATICALAVFLVPLLGCGQATDVVPAEQQRRKAETESRHVESQAEKPKDALVNLPDSHVVTKVRKYPGYITPHDIMTPEDEFYFHYLDNLCSGGDLATWPLVEDLIALGQNLVDANFLANLANETIHISDQPRATPIVKMVNECAQTLQVAAPAVHIDGSAEPNAYIAGLKEPHVLVLTSGLLDLYEESPEELRFIIGHELGHVKANHLRTHFLGSALVGALVGERSRNLNFATDFVAKLSIGTLLHWYRESEYSGDRAGLICIGGDVGTAKQSLLRLVHQTKPSNRLFDPSHPEFDAQLVLRNQLRLRDEPFVNIISRFRQGLGSHPFIPERCAALDTWSLSAEYVTIMERPTAPATNLFLIIESIQVTRVPKVDTYVPFVDSGAADPFVKLTHAGATTQTDYQVDATDVLWPDSALQFAYSAEAGVILELYDYNATLSNTFIGSCLLPIPSSERAGSVEADVRLDVLHSSTIIDRPRVTVQYRLAPKE